FPYTTLFRSFRVARIGFCAVAPGTATLHWQFSPPAPITRDTEIVRSTGDIANDRSTYPDYLINIVVTPTPEPIPTGVYCTASVGGASTTCSTPSTYHDTFTFGTSCYIGHNGTYGYYTVYFEVAASSGG